MESHRPSLRCCVTPRRCGGDPDGAGIRRGRAGRRTPFAQELDSPCGSGSLVLGRPWCPRAGVGPLRVGGQRGRVCDVVRSGVQARPDAQAHDLCSRVQPHDARCAHGIGVWAVVHRRRKQRCVQERHVDGEVGVRGRRVGSSYWAPLVPTDVAWRCSPPDSSAGARAPRTRRTLSSARSAKAWWTRAKKSAAIMSARLRGPDQQLGTCGGSCRSFEHSTLRLRFASPPFVAGVGPQAHCKHTYGPTRRRPFACASGQRRILRLSLGGEGVQRRV